MNTCFNNFLNTYTKLYDSCFPLKKVYFKSQNTAWITSGIRISCLNKRKLFIIQRNSQDPKLTIHYKKYCRILTRVIKVAKQKYYNNLISCSNNKTKTAWNIINNTTNRKPKLCNVTSININGNPVYNGHHIAEAFNKHFVSIAREMIATKLNYNIPFNNANALCHLTKQRNHPFPPINIKYTSTFEVENIIR